MISIPGEPQAVRMAEGKRVRIPSWFLVNKSGTRHRLPKEMIFVGREDCELMLQSRSVDKQHAVINYDPISDEHSLKDLGSLNGTFLNNERVPEQTYMSLKVGQVISFGFDPNVYTVVKGEHKVPEEALQHEKYTRHLQLDRMSCEGSLSESAVYRHSQAMVENSILHMEEKQVDTDLKTPELGKSECDNNPSDGDDQGIHLGEQSTDLKPKCPDADSSAETSVAASKEHSGDRNTFRREPSYFEIPTKDLQLPKDPSQPPDMTQPSQSLQDELPTRDTYSSTQTGQTHASFTIEFDSGVRTSRSSFRERSSRFPTEPRPKPKPPEPAHRSSDDAAGRDGVEVTIAGVASDVYNRKVQDWLKRQEPVGQAARVNVRNRPSERTRDARKLPPRASPLVDSTASDDGVQRGHTGETLPVARAFTIDFFDADNPRKRRSASFTHRDATLGSATAATLVPGPPAKPGVPHPSTRSRSLVRPPQDSSSDLCHAVGSQSSHRSRPPHGVESRSKKCDYKKDGGKNALRSVGVLQKNEHQQKDRKNNEEAENEEDKHSDAGTYTIESETPSREEQTERKRIDKVFGVLEPQPTVSRQAAHEGLCPGVRGPNTSQVMGSPEARTKSLVVEESVTLPEKRDDTDNDRGTGWQWASRWTSLAASGPQSEHKKPSSTNHAHSGSCVGERGAVSIITTPTVGAQASRRHRTLPMTPKQCEKLATSPTDHKENAPSCVGKKDGEIAPWSRRRSVDGSAVEPSTKTSAQLPSSEELTDDMSSTIFGDLCSTSSTSSSHGSSKRASSKVREAYAKDLVTKSRRTPSLPRGCNRFNKDNPNLKNIRHDLSSADSEVNDTTYLLRDTEAALHVLEAKVHATSSNSQVPSMGEVEISESSTSRRERHHATPPQNFTNKQRDRDAGQTPSTNVISQAGTQRTRIRPDTSGETQKASRHHLGTRGFPFPKNDSGQQVGDGEFSIEMSNEEEDEEGKGMWQRFEQTAHASVNSNGALSKPRPTRASLLRRARLGDGVDDGTVASEPANMSSPSPQLQNQKKKMRRLDFLAQPRQRGTSFSSGSVDSIGTSVRSSTSVRMPRERNSGTPIGKSQSFRQVRSSRSSSAQRREPVEKVRTRSNSINRGSSVASRHCQLLTDSTSTSDDESSGSAHRLRLTPAASRRTPPSSMTVPVDRGTRPRSAAVDRDASGEQGEEDYIKEWTSHSEEIARISQDLAKDLAILAKEIHEVAGTEDINSNENVVGQKGNLAGTATLSHPSNLAGTATSPVPSPSPESTIEVKEQLVQRIADEGIKFQKIPPHLTSSPQHTQENMNRRKTWSREEMQIDTLILTSIGQLSKKVRQETEKTAAKMRVLLRDEERNWAEIEDLMNAETEVPLLKTSNKGITCILKDLRRVEKQLEVINAMIDPDRFLDNWYESKCTQGTSNERCTSQGLDEKSPGTKENQFKGESLGSESDFSIHFNKFNPNGDEEDGPCYV
uniref:centrosomal protein of 170 kDa-like isoform X3 n=1 Tax=Myxine glutinosa TaxID=7769 RepID=UPI00358F771E